MAHTTRVVYLPQPPGKHLFVDTLPTPRHLPFTLTCNPANFYTENTVG